MNEIQAAVLALLPPKRKSTPSGWVSFNSVCCHHRGEKPDKRMRGGLLLSPGGILNYHCFNCHFKAGWSPGSLLSKNLRSLLEWIGMPDSEISKLGLYALKIKDSAPIEQAKFNFDLEERQLPPDSSPLTDLVNQELSDEDRQSVYSMFEYLVDRGLDHTWYNWHWSPASGYRDRLLIPFYHNGKIVGWSGRKIVDGRPKYLSEAQPGYVFNIDTQRNDRNFIVAVEGQLDAIAINGVAFMHNEVNASQAARLSALNKEVIVVPDRDRPGIKLIQSALDNHWSVSVPPWQDHIKDVADAVKEYGRLYTLFTILHYKEDNEIKIQLLKKKLEASYE